MPTEVGTGSKAGRFLDIKTTNNNTRRHLTFQNKWGGNGEWALRCSAKNRHSKWPHRTCCASTQQPTPHCRSGTVTRVRQSAAGTAECGRVRQSAAECGRVRQSEADIAKSCYCSGEQPIAAEVAKSCNSSDRGHGNSNAAECGKVRQRAVQCDSAAQCGRSKRRAVTEQIRGTATRVRQSAAACGRVRQRAVEAGMVGLSGNIAIRGDDIARLL